MALSDLQRRDKVTNRRNESGLKETKLYLNHRTYASLKSIAIKMGYSEKITNEDLSKVIEYLIRQKDPESEQLLGHKKKSQYLIFMHDIATYQKKIGYSTKHIVQFMNDNYELPAFLQKYSKWNLINISHIIDKNWIRLKINQTRKKPQKLLKQRPKKTSKGNIL